MVTELKIGNLVILCLIVDTFQINIKNRPVLSHLAAFDLMQVLVCMEYPCITVRIEKQISNVRKKVKKEIDPVVVVFLGFKVETAFS